LWQAYQVCGKRGRMSYEQEPPTDMDIWNDLQRQIDKLKSENKRLTKALTEIVELYKPTTLSLTAIKMCMVAEQALSEVTDSKTDYKEHLKNMSESEHRRMHEGRWENEENEVTK